MISPLTITLFASCVFSAFDCSITHQQEVVITRDLSESAIDRCTISFPYDWEVVENDKGVNMVGISSLSGPSDEFRENLTLQIFTTPVDKGYSSELIANYLFNGSAANQDSRTKVISRSEKHVSDSIEFYSIEYEFMYETTVARSEMFCMIEEGIVYMLIYTGSGLDYLSHKEDMESIINSFDLNR